MLSFVKIGPLVPEKMIFEGFLPYMRMAAILVVYPGLFIYTLRGTSNATLTFLDITQKSFN